MQIHINREGQQFGPYTVEEVRAYLAQGSLFPGDFAWYEGLPNWTPLSQIPGLGSPEAQQPQAQPQSEGVEAQPASGQQVAQPTQTKPEGGGQSGGVSASAAMERLRQLQKGGATPKRTVPGGMSARGAKGSRAAKAAKAKEEPKETVVVAAPAAWKKHLPLVGIIVGVLALVGGLVWWLWPEGPEPLPQEKVSSGVTSAMAKKLQGAGFEFNITSKREINAIWIKPGTTITPETLGQVAELKNLQRLQLRGCSLNDVAVSRLGSLIHLKQLDLRDNPDISDKVIVTLKKFTKLEKLGLDGTRITSRGNTDLKTVLTNCEISWKPLAPPEEKDKGKANPK